MKAQPRSSQTRMGVEQVFIDYFQSAKNMILHGKHTQVLKE
jgi:hypothetical protein